MEKAVTPGREAAYHRVSMSNPVAVSVLLLADRPDLMDAVGDMRWREWWAKCNLPAPPCPRLYEDLSPHEKAAVRAARKRGEQAPYPPPRATGPEWLKERGYGKGKRPPAPDYLLTDD